VLWRWLRFFFLFAWRPRRHHKPQRTIQLAIVFEAAMNSVSMTVGQSVVATAVPLEADGITQTPGAVVSNVTLSADPAFLSTFEHDDGTVTLTAMLGPGTATVTASATVTDADGTVTTLSATGTVVISAPAPPARTVSLGISFSEPA
jgi:hypothetical protein